jgi:pyruvate ferredoxin oxidoreductase alpha subunit
VLRQIEGSQAVARAVAACRPEVVCAYPISPQTHIIEAVGTLVRTGELHPCEFVNVESEFAAMSVSIGASATGARAYTATASQGLLYMMEAVHNASGLGLPIVMTLANRAIGAPINIWNDHSDAMAAADAGWIQLFAETNQEAVDLHVLAFRLAEELSVPVMVCMDGFVLTHAVEQVDLPEQAQVDRFLPPYAPRQSLDVSDPVSIGAMVGPEAFQEVKVLAHLRLLDAVDRIPELAAEFATVFGRPSAGLLSAYRTEDADTIVVALGSVLGTVKDAVDERRRTGERVGVVGVTTFRPFPAREVRWALSGVRQAVVVEKAFRTGGGGILSADVTLATRGTGLAVHTVVAGLGGRPVTRRGVDSVLASAARGELGDLTFLDLDDAVVEDERSRILAATPGGAGVAATLRRRPPPTAERVGDRP